MPQQLDNLIFDRTELDVAELQAVTAKLVAGTATAAERAAFLAGMKGAYNYTDLNRVGAAVEYLTALLHSLGYNVPTSPAKSKAIPLVNIVPNSSFEQNSAWSGIAYSSEQAYEGKRSSELGPGTTVTQTGTVETPKVGHSYYGRSYIKSAGDISPTDCRFELYAGDGPGLNFVFAWNRGNFPVWTMRSSITRADSVTGQNYKIRNFVVDAKNQCWTDGLMVIDLTEAFGEGNEPTKEWCDTNIPYFDGATEITVPGWQESDIQTPEQMEQYLNNIKLLRDRLPYVAPDAPASMEGLTYQEANDIEEILYTLEDVLEAMQAAFLTRQANTLFMIAGGVFNNV